jgi:Zn-dependent protease
MDNLGTGMIWFIAFLLSTTVHEAMHAWASLRLGDPTAYHGGQVTLSPVPHIQREPIGMLVVPLLTAFTMGWAMGWASAPYDPYWAARHPKRAALMAAAGPLGNFMLALLAFAVLRAGLGADIFVAPETARFASLVEGASGPNAITTLLSVFLMLNVLLGIFNLLPLPPLDGASVFSIFLPESMRSGMRDMMSGGMISLLGLVIAWQVFPQFIDPIFSAILWALHPGVAYG